MNSAAQQILAQRVDETSKAPLLREQLEAAIQALEHGDQSGLTQALESIGAPGNQRLLESVAQIARHVGETVGELNRDGRLTQLASSEIPDARSRLDYVVKLTEEAAHRTLDLVDDSRIKLNRLANLSQVPDAAPVIDGLRQNLSDLAQAQEYQDLSGQVIHRVILLVHEVEYALIGLLGTTGADLKFSDRQPKQGKPPLLPGPAVPEVDFPAASQQTADDLLADLGI